MKAIMKCLSAFLCLALVFAYALVPVAAADSDLIDRYGQTVVRAPYAGASANETIIEKNYTQSEWDAAADLLGAVTDSLYNVPDGLQQLLSDYGVQINPATVMQIHTAALRTIADTGKIEAESAAQPRYTALATYAGTNEFAGRVSFTLDGGKSIVSAWMPAVSPYITSDFFSHRVEIAAVLESAKLDLSTTTAVYVQIENFSDAYLLSDGGRSVLLTLGQPYEDSPLWMDGVEEGHPDAARYLRCISVQDTVLMAKDQVLLLDYYQEKYLSGSDAPLMGGGIIQTGRALDAEHGESSPTAAQLRSAVVPDWLWVCGTLVVCAALLGVILAVRKRRRQVDAGSNR